MKTVIPTPVVVIPNFLPVEDNENLLGYTLEKEFLFIPRKSAPGYPRQCGLSTDNGFEDWKLHINSRSQLLLSEVLKEFGLEPFVPSKIESGITAMTNGGFLGVHEDCFPAPTRLISFVYYFHSVPRAFTGGQLAVYNNQVDCFSETEKADSCSLVEPVNNTCVFFPSKCYHEVLPVACNKFSDARFSVAGWIHANTLQT